MPREKEDLVHQFFSKKLPHSTHVVFRMSLSRPLTALLGLEHMDRLSSHSSPFLIIVVVEADEFNLYRSVWSATQIILALPKCAEGFFLFDFFSLSLFSLSFVVITSSSIFYQSVPAMFRCVLLHFFFHDCFFRILFRNFLWSKLHP